MRKVEGVLRKVEGKCGRLRKVEGYCGEDRGSTKEGRGVV